MQVSTNVTMVSSIFGLNQDIITYQPLAVSTGCREQNILEAGETFHMYHHNLMPNDLENTLSFLPTDIQRLVPRSLWMSLYVPLNSLFSMHFVSFDMRYKSVFHVSDVLTTLSNARKFAPTPCYDAHYAIPAISSTHVSSSDQNSSPNRSAYMPTKDCYQRELTCFLGAQLLAEQDTWLEASVVN